MTDEKIDAGSGDRAAASGHRENEKLNEISELSKRGYQLFKENLIKEAEECFLEIL